MNKLICDMCEKDITYLDVDKKVKAVFKNKDNDGIKKDLCEECFKKVYEVIETNSQKELYRTLLEESEELNDKYLQKLVYALSPTTHPLDDRYNSAFKNIIADNIDLETCKIRRKLKECWGIDKY